MPSRFAVALYQSRGIAEDACKRLRTEGVPDAEVAPSVLRERGPMPATMSPASAVEPPVWGDVRNTFGRNGRTAVFVAAGSEEEADFALEILRHYAPIAVDVFAGEDRAVAAGQMRARAAGRR